MVDGLTVLMMGVVVIEIVVVIPIVYNILLAVTFGAVGTFPGNLSSFLKDGKIPNFQTEQEFPSKMYFR